MSLGGILFLYDVADTRLTTTSRRVMRMLERMCGADAYPCVTFVGTMTSPGKSCNEGEDQHPLVSKKMVEGGAKIVTFEDPQSATQAKAIVKSLLETHVKSPLRIQKEIVEEQKSVGQTEAAQALREPWMTRVLSSVLC